ncbi:MAG: hypothetical protein J4469_05190, partial [Candidatus Aenigmarchaeota archaeon]|nr:hypothetical protein [Candidatus Aenigmarchaeota archaeon]
MVAAKIYGLVLVSMLVIVFSINFAPALPITGKVAGSAWTHRGGSLSADVQGWAYNPAIAAAQDGTIYAAWTQHRNPSAWVFSGIYVKRWAGSSWEQLGARIGHTSRDADWPEAYDPSIAVLGTTPYVAWYEGGGYGWGNCCKVSVFVAHWDGTRWIYDNNSAVPNGALNTDKSFDARNPVLAVVGGVLYVAWIEAGDYVAVKHLTANGWVQDGGRIPTGGSKVIDVAIADAGGVPYVVFSGFQRSGSSNLPSTMRAYRLSAGAWVQMGGEIKAQTNDYTNYLAMAAIGTTPYVAMQEKSPNGNYQIYVKRWDGSAWVQDGGSLNIDPANGEAGRPALASDGTRLWLSWTEGLTAEKSKLYVRSLSGSTWSTAEGPLNVDAVNGPADSPALAVGGVPHVIWAEKDMNSYTKQVYVKGRDSTGSFVPTVLSRWGSSGPSVPIPPNTWVSMQAGGI